MVFSCSRDRQICLAPQAGNYYPAPLAQKLIRSALWAGGITDCPITYGYSSADKSFTDIRIRREPDCAIARTGDIPSNVALSSPIRLSEPEKLDVLRRLDQFRHWGSLEEKRYCLVCGKIITGEQIQVSGGTRGNGPLRLSCPTERCNSIPMDWVLPTDEIIAMVERMAAKERKAAVPVPTNHINGGLKRSNREHNGIASQLRKFAFHFKRSF